MADPLAWFGLAVRIVQRFMRQSDLEPCNTRLVKRRLRPGALFRTVQCAVHRMPNGRWEMNPIDPVGDVPSPRIPDDDPPGQFRIGF